MYMPMVRGSSFRKDYDKIERLESPFKEEILRINEELKQLNLEHDGFFNKLFGGIKSLLYKNRPKILLKKDLNSKYNLECFFKQLNKDSELLEEFQSYSIRKNAENITSAEIGNLYNYLEDQLFATICFVEMIEKYKNSNYQINELYQKKGYAGPFVFEHILLFSTQSLFIYIENPQIKEFGQKMYDEYIQQTEESEKIGEKIIELESSIQDKMSQFSEKNLTLEQLREYKDLLVGADKLLSKTDENSNNNFKKK